MPHSTSIYLFFLGFGAWEHLTIHRVGCSPARLYYVCVSVRLRKCANRTEPKQRKPPKPRKPVP